ncbi:anthrone oxygenase family protein [Mariniluteicoccus flavus]
MLTNLFALAASAVVAGVYANFSARVMPRLATLATTEGVATMQGFNRTAVQAPFMIAFFGGAALGAFQVARFVRGERGLVDTLAAGAGLAHLAAFRLTLAYNVPRNEHLARLSPGSAEAGAYWPVYLREWTGANTVRAVCALAAVALGGAAVAATVRGTE